MQSIQIKNAQAGSFENLHLIESDTPEPKLGEVLVRWHATSLNYHDLLVAFGFIPVPNERIPMSDGAGEIVAVGDGVTQWKKGDQVMSLFFPKWIEGKPTLDKTRFISGETVDGYATEYSCISADALTSIPNGYNFAQAATLPCAALTAWRAVMVEGQIQPGQTVLIEGSGGMSIFGLQFAIMAGARVIATTSSPAKAERLEAMGAAQVVNYKEDERWGKTIFKKTGGVDLVLDVGGGSTMRQSIEAVAIGGKVISIGILGDGRKGEITFPKLFFKHIQMTGIAVGSRVMQEDMVSAINTNGLAPVLDKSFALDQLGAAFMYQASGQHFGKIVAEF